MAVVEKQQEPTFPNSVSMISHNNIQEEDTIRKENMFP